MNRKNWLGVAAIAAMTMGMTMAAQAHQREMSAVWSAAIRPATTARLTAPNHRMRRWLDAIKPPQVATT